MKKDLVLAVAVLSVLAGIMVGSAQSRPDNEQEVSELRQLLIDDEVTMQTAGIPGLIWGVGVLWDYAQNEMCDSFAGGISSCEDDYNRCLEDAFYNDIGNPNAADADQTTIAQQKCEIQKLTCELDENKVSSACQWLLPFKPRPESTKPDDPANQER